MKVNESVVIDKPFDEVWAIFDDPSLQPEWLDIMKSFEQVKGVGNEKGAIQNVVFERDSGETRRYTRGSLVARAPYAAGPGPGRARAIRGRWTFLPISEC